MKQLKNSDVGVLRRIVLPKKESETNLPILESKEGILITMLDMDGIHQWSFKYRYCPNNNSRMYVLEYTGEFVHEHKLTVNNSIIVYHNIDDGEYIIEGRKTMLVRSTPMWGCASYTMSWRSLTTLYSGALIFFMSTRVSSWMIHPSIIWKIR